MLHHRYANRCLKFYLMLVHIECMRTKPFDNIRTDLFCLIFIDVFQYHDKFISVKPCEGIFGADMLFEKLAEFNDQNIPHVVTVFIIHRLEFIKVDIEHSANCFVMSFSTVKHPEPVAVFSAGIFSSRLKKPNLVEKTGERVGSDDPPLFEKKDKKQDVDPERYGKHNTDGWKHI